SLACAAGGLATSFGQLLVARFAVGAGEAGLVPCAYSIIGDSFPRRKLGVAIAAFSASNVLGGSLAYLLGGWIYSFAEGHGPMALPWHGELHPWQLVFLL